MASERSMRKRVVSVLAELDAVPVENPAQPGTPDVNLTTGWVELKSLSAWPKRPRTPVRVPKFQDRQRYWLQKRRKAGGNAWVLIRIGRDWLLFDGWWAARYLGNVNQQQLRTNALCAWDGKLSGKELQRCLSVNLPEVNDSSYQDAALGRLSKKPPSSTG